MKLKHALIIVAGLFVGLSKLNAQNNDSTVQIEEITVFTTRVINSSGARYHIDGCRYLRNGQIKVDEKIALNRGLLPCSVCLPERTKDLKALKGEKQTETKTVFRKCAFKTSNGAKCKRPALDDGRYCELHKSRENKRH